MSIEKTIIIRASSFMTKKLTSGKKNEATIAPSDTNFESKKTIRNIPKQINAVSRLIDNIIPKVVATPLPPLKLANIGNT